MAIDCMRRPVGIHVGHRARHPRAEGLPRARKQVQGASLRALGKKIDRLEKRVVEQVSRAETRIVDKLHQKEQADLQRIEDAKMGWSKFILKRCAESFVSVCMRNLPLIISMVLSIEIASGAAAGPLGLGVSFGAIVVVALAVLLWEVYKAFREYRALKRAAANQAGVQPDNNAPSAPGDVPQPAAAPRGAARATGSADTDPVAPHAAAAPPPPRRNLRQRCGAWRQGCADFMHFVMQRGIR